MVSFNPNAKSVQTQTIKTVAPKKNGDPEKLEKTTGNNTGAGPKINVNGPCYTIKDIEVRRDPQGNKYKVYILDGDLWERDMKYFQDIANATGETFIWEVENGGGSGRVTPD